MVLREIVIGDFSQSGRMQKAHLSWYLKDEERWQKPFQMVETACAKVLCTLSEHNRQRNLKGTHV